MKCFNNRFKSCRKAQVYRGFFPSSKIWHKGKTFLGIVEQMMHFIDFSKENENRGPSFKCFHCQTQKKGSVLLIFFLKFLYKTYFWKDFSFNFVFLKHVFSFSSHYIDFCNEFAGKASPSEDFCMWTMFVHKLLFLHFQPVYILYQSFLVPKCYLDFCGSPLIAFLKSDRENCTLEALFFLFYTLLRCMTCPSALNNLIKSWGKNIARHNAATAGFFSYFL